MDDAVDVHLVEDVLGLGRLDPVHVNLLTVVGRQHQGLINLNRSAELNFNVNINIINVKLFNKYLCPLFLAVLVE